MLTKILSKYRLPTDAEREEYEDTLRRRVDRCVVRALADHNITATVDPETNDLLVEGARLTELDQWRVSVVDHSKVFRVYAEAKPGSPEIEISLSLEKRPKIKIKPLVSFITKLQRAE